MNGSSFDGLQRALLKSNPEYYIKSNDLEVAINVFKFKP